MKNLGIDEEDVLNMRMQGKISLFAQQMGRDIHIALSQSENQTDTFHDTEMLYLKSHAPLLSVIVPVYNVEPYLSECLDSILQQTYPHLDIILIDDGSTDNSGVICDQYKEKDSRIRVFHTDNGGQARARNMGLREARGEFVSFIDSDDWIELDMYERAVREFLFDPQLSIVRFGYQKCYSDGSTYIEQEYSYSEIVMSGIELLETYAGQDGMNALMCSSIYKTQLFRSNNLYFFEGIVHEDEMLSLCLACFLSQRQERVKMIRQVMYNYRRDIVSTVSQLTSKHVRDMSKGFELVYEYANTQPELNLGLLYTRILLILCYYMRQWLSFNIPWSEITNSTSKIRSLISPEQIYPARGRWLFFLFCYSPRLYCYVERLYAPIVRRLGISNRFK